MNDEVKSTLDENYIPTAPLILAEIFKDYRFMLDGARMTPSLVFGPSGFLPVISFMTTSKMRSLYGDAKDIPITENDDSVVGFMIDPLFQSTNELMMYLIVTTDIAKEMFGDEASNKEIVLDKLYDWTFNAQEQEKGIPVMSEEQS